MKTSWANIQRFAAAADIYLATKGKEETKLAYAIGRVKARLEQHQKKLQERLTDIEIDTCVVNDAGVIQRDGNCHLQFTREGIKERNRLQREELEKEQFEIEPHYVALDLNKLGPVEIEAFAGFVLKPESKAAAGD
jgi:hypothetical protein